MPCCSATGIGSLPHTGVETALDLVLASVPEVPHWPQLPRRGHIEHFVYQYLWPLVRLGLLQEDRIIPAAAADFPDRLAEFFGLYLEAEADAAALAAAFATPLEAAPGLYAFMERMSGGGAGRARYLKGQIAGPLSVGLNVFDDRERPAFYDPQLRELLIKCLAAQARWQAMTLAKPGLPVMVFVDDPAVAAWGSSTYIVLDRAQIIAALAEVVEAIHAGGGLAGVHSCAAVDWAIFWEAGFDILSLDTYAFFPSLLGCSEGLRDFLQRGGVLAWGIVPTSDAAWGETPATLARKWQEQVGALDARGIAAELVYRQSLITPSCGTGTLEIELAENIYRLLRDLAELIQAGAPCRGRS